jgi:hypothetical protein
MNPYVVSVSGIWPNERYVYNINPSVIDYRFNQMPIKFLCAPYYTEDNDITELTYTPPKINQLVGLSSNSNFFVTQNDLQFNTNVIPNLTFSWSPSALRKENRGNVFGSLMLATEEPTYYGATVYPSQLFLYPVSASVINQYQILTSDITVLSAYDFAELNNLTNDIVNLPNVNSFTVNALQPPVSTIWYTISTVYTSSFYIYQELYTFLNDSFTIFWLSSSYTINNGITSVYYSLSAPYVSSLRYNSIDELNTFYNDIKVNVYKSYVLTEYASAISYDTLIYQVTSQNYFLQTSTVLIKPYEFQFADWNYGKAIKKEHSQFLSQIPEISENQNISLDNIMYELSGSVTRGNHSIISFYDNINPIYYNTVLEPGGYFIRPDTIRLQYFINFYDYISQPEPFIRTMGDEFDDLQLFADRSIESSYILKRNDLTKTLTFQLLQSSVDTQLPLEDASNCVLSAVLNFDTSRFNYYNTAKYVYNTDNFGVVTPVSGVRDTKLSLKYIAETPYLNGVSQSVESTIISISSSPAISLNTPINWQSHNRTVNWKLKYPPYYYSFKNSYKKLPSYNYENKNTLNFYLSSTVFDTQIKNITSDNIICAQIDLYTSVYSDFDILELPLSTYGYLDFIKFELDNESSLLNKEYLSAFLVNGQNTIFYDISSSPYIPAISGSYLRLLYNLNGGGTVISIRPGLSTGAGVLEAYWATTFPVALDYNISNYINPIKIQTLKQDLSSISLTVNSLSGENSELDLSQTNIVWNYLTNDVVSIENLSTNINNTPIIEPTKEYLFEDANTIKITGLTNETLTIYLSSEKYNMMAVVSADPDYFDLYAQNTIDIINIFENKKGKIKKLGFVAEVSYFTRSIPIPNNAAISWAWKYDDIIDSNSIPVSAFADFNCTSLYKYGSLTSIQSLPEIYFLIDTDYTLTEVFKSFNLTAEVYDQGKIINGELVYSINSYPDPTIINADFDVVYDKFPNISLLDTSKNIKSLTRPPNGTNIFKFIPQNLRTSNVYIPSLEWIIDSEIAFESVAEEIIIPTSVITLSTNTAGDYETALVKSFNLYEKNYKNYINAEYLNGNDTRSILSQNNLNVLLSALSVNSLAQNNSYLVYLSSRTNLSPIATSLFVVSTSKYISSFDLPDNFSFLNDYNNLYTTNYYTSTISVLSGNKILYTYNNYVVDFWLSSANTQVSDNWTIVSLFSTTNITNNSKLLFYNTSFNLTTSLSYGISSDIVPMDRYYYNTITLKAGDVSIPGWINLYDIQQSSRIIITNGAEFSTSPYIFTIPRFSWAAENNKRVNRHLQVLDIQKPFDSYFKALSGKNYKNKKDSIYEYDLRISNVQDRNIGANEKLTFLFATGNEEKFLLSDQIINSPEEYILLADSRKDVIIKNFKIPYNQEILESTGMNLSVTAFNRFFPVEGGVSYYGIENINSKELKMFNYPITASTLPREYSDDGKLRTNLLMISPRLFEYEPCKLIFYPKLKTINLDEGGLVQVKQILETNPPNSPNIINYDLSTITYTLSSDFWVSSITIPAISSATINLFNITVGDAMKPLQVSNYNTSNLVISASARVATKILATTFNKTQGYTGETDLWETVYQEIIGNTENVYKFLNFEISSRDANTETPSVYYPIKTGNDWILVI